MDAEQQEVVLKEVAGKYPIDRFIKDSIVAPLQLSRETIKNADGERIGHRVDLWFVAHGSLDAIRDQDLFAAMVDADRSEQDDSGKDDSGKALTDAELAARGLQVRQQDGRSKASIGFRSA